MLGRWIDSLTDEERDRVVAGLDWSAIGSVGDAGREMCVMQHAANRWDFWRSFQWGRRGWRWGVAYRFTNLCNRFGTDRVVRAIKLRAGATLDDLPQPEREAAGAK